MSSPYEQPDNLPLLLQVIRSQPAHRLQGILQDIVKHSPEGRKIASKWLLAVKDNVPVVPTSTTPVTDTPPVKEESISTPVAMTPRFETCLYCMGEFEVTKNSATSCKYHVEPDIIDEEFFKEEIFAGLDVDNLEYREIWPDGFYHPCCGRDLTEDMCQVGWHKAVDPEDRPRKRDICGEFQ